MRTFTCLIVDDEDLILQRLEKLFHQRSITDRGYRLEGTAYSAEDAIRLAEKVSPDIMITDIVMPGMNGIEMIEYLKLRLPRTAFIILSAYQDFQYAKQAMAMNVLDYLVKVPLRESELVAALEKASSKLLMEEGNRKQFSQLQHTVQSNIYRLRKQFIQELISSHIHPASLQRRSKEIMIDFPFDSYCCIAVHIDDFEQFRQRFSGEDQSTLKYGMLNILEEIMSRNGSGFACEIGNDGFVGFFSCAHFKSAMQQEQSLYALGQEITMNIKKFLKQSMSVGFSTMKHGPLSVIEAYREAEEAVASSFYTGRGSVNTPAFKQDYTETARNEASEILRSVLDRLSGASPSGAEAIKEEVRRLRELIEQRKVAPKVWGELLEPFFVRLGRLPLNDTGVSDMNWKSLNHNEQVVQLVAFIEEYAQGLNKHTDERPEISKAKRYIEQYLTERISLQRVADHVNLNPSYFSELFKKEVKESFIDYVNRRRIMRAIALMKSGTFSNAALSESVGIGNEAYFCTLFKKYTGKSPQKY